MLDERKLDEGREYLLRFEDDSQGEGQWYAYLLPLATPPFSEALHLEVVELSDVCDCSTRSPAGSSSRPPASWIGGGFDA